MSETYTYSLASVPDDGEQPDDVFVRPVLIVDPRNNVVKNQRIQSIIDRAYQREPQLSDVTLDTSDYSME